MNDSAAERSAVQLTDRMTLSEKLGQLTMVSANMAITGPGLAPDYLAAVRAGEVGNLLNLWGAERVREAQRLAVEETRLGIPLLVGFDVVHGHRTIFPIPLAEAAAFDPDLWERTARAAAVEATADGLTVAFAPMVDVARDPRWGRIAEGAGEDPWLTARFAEAKVRGFQGADLAAADAMATTVKHFCAYGAVNAGREYASVDVSDRQLEEIYLPPFEAAVRAGAVALMPAFNDVGGIPMSVHRALLHDRLRGEWGFTGIVISDYTAIFELINHGVAADLADAAALALRAGVDIDMMADGYRTGLPLALDRGTITMAEIDAAVRRVLRLKFRLGLFADPYRRGIEGGVPASTHAYHRALAREAARRSAVLLTNRRRLLPLASVPARIALIGPLADDRAAMLGTWGAAGRLEETVSLLDGVRQAWPGSDVQHAQGVPILGDSGADIAAACALGQAADLILLCVGEDVMMSGEAASRARPELPGRQTELAGAVLALGRPTVVLLSAGRPLIEPSLFEAADTVLAIFALGSEGGHAVVDLLTGRFDCTGRLPVSWPRDIGQVPLVYNQRPTGRPADPANRYSSKYIDLPVTPLFPFGHGLSYAQWALANLRIDRAELHPGEVATIEVDVANTGERAGEETVLLFVRDPVACVARPVLELKGVARLALEAGGRSRARFQLTTDDLKFPGPDLAPLLEPGVVHVLVGTSATPAALLQQHLTVVTEPRQGADAPPAAAAS